MQDAKSEQNLWALEGMFFLDSITSVCFHHDFLHYNHFLSFLFSLLFIYIFIFTNLKNYFSPSMKGFQSLKRVLKYLID